MEQQKTINKDFILEGIGLQTGLPVKAFFYPANENSGIIFVRKDLEGKPEMRLGDSKALATDRRSKISLPSPAKSPSACMPPQEAPGFGVETTEHVLAALWGAGIDNVGIELDGAELPGMDGSSLVFLEALKKAGVKTQSAERKFIEVDKPVWVEDEESFLGIFPSDTFKISYLLQYRNLAIGRQFFSGTINDEIFREEIAPARTFCLKEEADYLLKQGYGRGANLKNTLVMTKDGPLENTLRFSDEPVRHKVLDLIGDLYLLGRPVKGRLIAIRSGHKLNSELVKKIQVTLSP